MSNTASLKKEYAERIAPALKSQFQYSSSMQIPVLKKIVINQGLGMAVADKKIIEVAINVDMNSLSEAERANFGTITPVRILQTLSCVRKCRLALW